MRSAKTRWLWLVTGMLFGAGQAAADEPAPSPAAPGTKYRLAVVDVKPPPDRQQAAKLAVAAVHEAAAADDRFELAPPDDVANARALWDQDVVVLTEDAQVGSGMEDGNAEMSRTQACAVGHAAGAARLLLVSGYALELPPARAAGAPVATQVSHGGVAPGPPLGVRLTATLTVINVESCKVRERAVVSARAESSSSLDEAVAGVRAAFARSAGEALQRLLPLHSGVRAVTRHGGDMNRGARDGVREGQWFEVHRSARPVGHVHVEDVAEEQARVSLVRGVTRLQPGDRLVESKAVRIIEAGATITPNVLARTRADDVFGVALGVHLMTYRPVSSNMYVFTFERLALTDFSRIRGGLEIGRQIRIMPRRLFAYGRVGVGVVSSHQTIRNSDGMAVDKGTLLGFELLNAVGVKALFGDALVVHLSASLPIGLYDETWYLQSWDNKMPVPEEMLIYPSPFRFQPTLTLAAGWSF
jgi:hypothetical protein